MFKLSRPRPLLFIFFFVVVVWPFLFYLNWLSKDASVWEQLVQSDTFLMKKRGLGYKNCIALTSVKDLDVLIVGSSHASLAIDHYVLAQSYPERRIDTCTFAGWSVDMFEVLLPFLEANQVHPKKIIWIADSGSFLRIPSSTGGSRQGNFQSNLKNSSLITSIRFNWWLKSVIGDHIPLRLTPQERYHSNLDEARNSFSMIPLSNAEQIVASHTFPDEIRLSSFISRGTPIKGGDVSFGKLCNSIELSSMTLDVVVYPLPDIVHDKLHSTFSKKQGWDQILKTGQFIQDNLPCINNVVEKPIAEWGLDIRHFMNLSEKVYNVWEKPEFFMERYSLLSKKEKAKILDADHLNSLGATVFSKRLFEILPVSQ